MEYAVARESLKKLAVSQKGRFLEERTDTEMPTSPEFIGIMSGRAVSLALDDGAEFRLWTALKYETPFSIKLADDLTIESFWIEEEKNGVSVSPMNKNILTQVLKGTGLKDTIVRMGLPMSVAVEKKSLLVHVGIGGFTDMEGLMEFVEELLKLAGDIEAFLERARREDLWI